jgi:hypothetical protein
MTNPIQKLFHSQGRVWMVVFVFIFCYACQANISPAPAATHAPSQTITPTVSPSPTLRPSPTENVKTQAEPSPTASADPIASEDANTAAAPSLSPAGPWLVLRQVQYTGEGYPQVDLILLNQDGAGRAQIPAVDCTSSFQILNEAQPGNFLARLEWETYLINPHQSAALRVDDPAFPCGAYFSQGDQAGLWAIAYQQADDSPPGLRIYQLPEGRLLNTFAMLRCTGAPEDCTPDDVAWGSQVWDPTGRYLAFPAVLDGGAAGLFIYDVKQNQARQVARFEGSISDIRWSPDGKQVIVMLSRYHDLPNVESVWAVRLTGGQPRRLYTPESPSLQEIVAWVDNDRFLLCDGSLRRAASEGAYNLRLVQISTGAVKDLFMDGFVAADLDRKSQTVALYSTAYNSRYETGVYLISLSGSEPRPLEWPSEVVEMRFAWREDLGLFVTGDACQQNPGQYWAFDVQGKWRCAALPAPDGSIPEGIWPSPDGKWQASAQDGLWLEGAGKTKAQVFQTAPSQVIWQPDSGGFFFIAEKSLYHVSLPGVTLTDLSLPVEVDESGSGQVAYQWIGGK